jgi:hypothetical protein
MLSLLGLAAVGAFLGVMVLWDLAVIAMLRVLSIKLSFSTPFHFYRRKERELIAALKGRPKDTYILISGFWLFACPLFAGSTAVDYIVRRYIDHSTFGFGYVTGSVVFFILLAIGGVWISASDWRKFAGNKIGGAS